MIAPGLVYGLTYLACTRLNLTSLQAENSGAAALVLYGGACAWLAYKKFQSLQLVDSQSLALSRDWNLSDRLGALVRWLRFSRVTGPTAALIKKELRLQSIAFFAAAAFCLLAAIGGIIYLTGVTFADRQTKVGEVIFTIDLCLYVGVLPLLVGTMASTEEKSWGVVDWHATLSPSSVRQWLLKIVVALAVSVSLGFVLPVLLLIASGGVTMGDFESPSVRIHTLSIYFAAHVLITSVAIYAGSWASNTARAMVLAVAIFVIGGWFIAITAAIAQVYRHALVRGADAMLPLQIEPGAALIYIGFAAVFVLFCLLHGFAFAAHRNRPLPWRWRILQGAFLLLVVCVFATAGYAVSELVGYKRY
jgi:hypothetical protein